MTWVELAAVLGCTDRALSTWRKRPDAPQSRDAAEWLAYRDANGLGESGPKVGFKELREEKLRREIKLADIRIAREERKLIDRGDVDALLHHIAVTVRSCLYQALDTELPVRCDGLSAAEIRPIMRETADGICDRLTPIVERWRAD